MKPWCNNVGVNLLIVLTLEPRTCAANIGVPLGATGSEPASLITSNVPAPRVCRDAWGCP